MSDNQLLDVLVASTSYEAERINSFELRPCDTEGLPSFTAGAHIDLYLPNGLTRSYSLVNAPSERHRYVIAVSHDLASKGGSRYLFEHSLVGQVIQISRPRNNFRLDEDSRHTIFIAGGIGITPIYCMIQRLEEIKAGWQLHYGARDRRSCAFFAPLTRLQEQYRGRVHFNFDLEDGRLLDLPQILASPSPDADLYCCGPVPMLEAFKAAATGHPIDKIHLEYFTPALAVPLRGGTAFSVTIASTGKTFEISPGRTILDVLLEAGVKADSACQAGACGTCQVGVLHGIPDHHDFVLTREERAANDRMMICVSRSKSPHLLLDL
jgi:ferredoxin-NADP reductase